jgi:hypothetical protein
VEGVSDANASTEDTVGKASSASVTTAAEAFVCKMFVEAPSNLSAKLPTVDAGNVTFCRS